MRVHNIFCVIYDQLLILMEFKRIKRKMSCSPSAVGVYPFVPTTTAQWKIRTVAKRDNTAGSLTQYYSIRFTSRAGAVQTTSSRNFLDSYDFQETFGTLYTESAFWSLIVEGRVEIIFGGGYMSTPQIANGDDGTQYRSVLYSYFGAVFSSTVDGTWIPTQWEYTGSRPSNWRGYVGFDILSTNFVSSQSGSILFYLQPTLIYDAGYPSNTFQGQIWRSSSAQASQLVSQFDLNTNVKAIAITNTFTTLRNYAYTLKIVEVTPLGALVTGRFNDVPITSQMGASLTAYRMSGLESTTYPIQIAGTQSAAQININCMMTGTNESNPTNAAQTYPYIRFGVTVFTTGSFPSHSFTVFAGESQTTYYFTLVKGAQIVQGANIPFRTNGDLQTSTNFSVESVRTMFNSNFPIVFSPYVTGNNPRFSTTFMPVKAYDSLANFVTLAENTPNVVLTNVLHSYTLANSLDASLNNQTVQLNMYMEYVTEPVVPVPPQPIVTYGPNLVGGTQLIQESAVEEGKEIIQNLERNLTAKQSNEAESFKYMYAEYYMPEDVELVNRAKRDIHNFLRSGETQNSWRDSTLNQFLGTFNSKSNPKQINSYPHLSNEHAQKKLQEYYPDAKTLMDLFDHPKGINRPYFESIRQEQLSFVPGQVGFWDKVANSIGSAIGISSRHQKHQFSIASDTTGNSWSDLTKAYFKYGTFYEPFNKSQSLMRMNIYQPMGTKQPLYIPEIDDANYDNEGIARRAYDAIAEFLTNERKQTIVATTVAARAFVNQRSTADLAKEQVKLLEKALGSYRGATVLAAQDVITTIAGTVATDWLIQKGVVFVDDLIKTKALQAFFFTQPTYDRFITQTPYRPIYKKPNYNSFSLSFISNPALVGYGSQSLAPEPLALIGSKNSLALQLPPPVHEPLIPGVLHMIATEQDNPIVQTVIQSSNSTQLQTLQREVLTTAIETLFHVEGREQAKEADRQSQFLAYQNMHIDHFKYYDMPSGNPVNQFIDAFSVGIADTIKLANLTYYQGLPLAAQAAKDAFGSTVDIASKTVQIGDEFVVNPAFDYVITPAVFYSLNGLWELIKWGGPEIAYGTGRLVKYTTKAAYNAAADYIEKENAYNKANNAGFLRVVGDISNATNSIVNKTNYTPQDSSVREAMRNVSEEIQAAKFNKTQSSIYNATDPGQIYVKIIEGTIRVLKVGDRKNIAKGLRSDNTTTIDQLSHLASKVKDSVSLELNKVAPAAFAGVNYLKGITQTDLYKGATDYIKGKLGISTEKPKRKVVLYKPKNQFRLSDVGIGDNNAQQFYNPSIPPSIPPPTPVLPQVQEILPTDPQEQIERVSLPTPVPQSKVKKLVNLAKENPLITAAGGALLGTMSWKMYFGVGVIGKPIPDVIATTNSDVTATEDGRQRNIHALEAILTTAFDNIKVNRDMEKSVRQGMGMEMSHFALRQRMKNNMHGYFHFKVLKALADPETADELELQRTLKKFLSVKSISNSSWQDDIKSNQDSQFGFLMEALGKAPLLHNFIERITHQYSGSHKQSSLGGMYITQRARAPYELSEYKGVRPLAQTFIKKRDQKRK